MKKTLLIIGGVLLILIIVGIWAYLFVFGKPTDGSGGIFSNFGLGGDEPVITDTTPSIVDTSPVDQSGAAQKLRQLTTRPVAGAEFIDGGIRYVERGTGHIFDIMFSTGQETQISSFTIARVVDAILSNDGMYIALTTESSGSNNVYVGSLTEDGDREIKFTGAYLPTGAREIAFSDDGTELFYVNDTASGASGFAYDMVSEESALLFTVPMRDIRVLWEPSIYVYTTPSTEAVGYIYKVTGNTMAPATNGGVGLVAFQYPNGIVVSESTDTGLLSVAYEESSEYSLGNSLLPEKCVPSVIRLGSLICAQPLTFPTDMPDVWYQGKITSADLLWQVDIHRGEGTLIHNLSDSGRNIDVARIGADETGRYIYFINKNDDTLWMYDMTP